MDETGLVSNIREAILNAYPTAWIQKIHGSPYQEAGIPDLVMCVEGRLFAFEVKHQKPDESAQHAYGRTTDVQRVQIRRITEAGGVACTILSPGEALDAIDATLNG